MGFIPLPSHIHYELLLQLLERQTLPALDPVSPYYSQVQTVIIHLRKALSYQKQLEENVAATGVRVEHRWSLNHSPTPQLPHPEGWLVTPPEADRSIAKPEEQY